MAYATILTETRDRVRYVTLNRPERRNALSLELQNELIDALTAAEQDEEAGSIVIRGAGPAFCSGFDITPRGRTPGGETPIRPGACGPLHRRMPDHGLRQRASRPRHR